MKRTNSEKISFDVIYDIFCSQFGSYKDLSILMSSVNTIYLSCVGERTSLSSLIFLHLVNFCSKYDLVFSVHSVDSRPEIIIVPYEM